MGLPKLTAVDPLKSGPWGGGCKKDPARPLRLKTAVAREKRRGAARLESGGCPGQTAVGCGKAKGAEKKGQPIGLKPVVKPGLQVGKQPPKRVTVKPPSGRTLWGKRKAGGGKEKHLTLLPIVPREAKHREKPTAVKKKPMGQCGR